MGSDPEVGMWGPQAHHRNATLFWDTLSMSARREDCSFKSLHYWPLMLTNINPALKSYGTVLFREILCVVSEFVNVTSGEAASRHYKCQLKLPFDSVTDTIKVIKGVFMYFFYSQISSSTFFLSPQHQKWTWHPRWHLLFMIALVALPWISI